LRRVGRDHNSIGLDAHHALPGNPVAFRPSGQALNEAARAGHQRDQSAAVAMDFVNPAETLSVESHDLIVLQVREQHHMAPTRGMWRRTRYSTA